MNQKLKTENKKNAYRSEIRTYEKKSSLNFFQKIISFIKAMRVYQWSKNILVFLPIILAHQFQDFDLMLKTIFAFFSFCFLASAGYILNDFLDRESDREHPDKKDRPIASGRVTTHEAIFLFFSLFAIGITTAYLQSMDLLIVTLIYFLCSTSYSIKLKEVPILDVFLLTSLYAWRILGGSIVTNIPISAWFLAFSGFLFWGLALVKRGAELKMNEASGKKNNRRGYLASDFQLVSQMGVSSNFLSVLVFAFYIHDKKVQNIYHYPELLWLICPLLMGWFSRVWLKVHRGEMHHDPIVFAAKDGASLIMWLLIVSVWWMAGF